MGGGARSPPPSTSRGLTRRRQHSRVRVITPLASGSDVATTGRAGFGVADDSYVTLASTWNATFHEDVHRQDVLLLRNATYLQHSRASPAPYPGTSRLPASRACYRCIHGWKLYYLPIRRAPSDNSRALMTASHHHARDSVYKQASQLNR